MALCGFRVQKSSFQILALPLICVTMSKLLSNSKPQFPHLYNETKNSTYLSSFIRKIFIECFPITQELFYLLEI